MPALWRAARRASATGISRIPPSWIVLPCVPGRMVEMKCPDFYKLIISHTAGKCKPVCIFLSAPPGAFAIHPTRARLPPARRFCHPARRFSHPPRPHVCRPPGAFAIRPARHLCHPPRPALCHPPGAFAIRPARHLCHPPHPRAFAIRPALLATRKKTPEQSVLCSGVVEATPGIEPGNEDFADPCLTAWLCRRGWSGRRGSNPPPQPWQGCALPNELLPQIRRHGGGIGTPSGARTLDTLIKSQVLYQLS